MRRSLSWVGTTGCALVLGLSALGAGCGNTITTAVGTPIVPPGGESTGTVSALQPQYHQTISQNSGPPPISGGTLAVSSDGNFAYAADPDRDAFYVVDLNAQTSVTIPLQAGDEPGRVIEDGAGHVHVALRRAGAIATIDPVAHTVLSRTTVCARPRGVAYMASNDSVYVACAGGELVTLPAAGGAPTRSVFVEADLRDVVVVGSSLYASELRSGMVLAIAADGTIANRFQRPQSSLEPGVAWRMIATQNGIAATMQAASTTPIDPTPGSYGTGGCGGAVTNPQIAMWGLDGTSLGMTELTGVLPVDLAVSHDGTTFAVVFPGEWLVPGSPQLSVTPNEAAPPPPEDAGVLFGGGGGGGGCDPGNYVAGQATAVAFDSSGRVLVQTREPAQLIIDAAGAGNTVSLSSISRDDTGHEIFHSDQGGGIACASCHIEGGDDGRTWSFSDVGLRRTPSVLGTVAGTAPYHWDGSQTNLPLLYSASLARMSGPTLATDQETAFSTWLGALPGPAATAGDPDAIARGAALFQGAGGCDTCHSGPRFTNNQTIDVGTGNAFQVPPLVGVSVRAPYLHNGCAPTLVEAMGTCGSSSPHSGKGNLTSAQLSDLAAYLGTL